MLARHPVGCIVLAIFFATGLWFTPNGVMPGLLPLWPTIAHPVAWLTGAIQAGFVLGTLLSALLGLADRLAPHKIWIASALIGAAANALFVVFAPNFPVAATFRFITGIALAGVYPIGMKLVVLWRPEARQRALSWLVAALTLGTAFPHLMRGFSFGTSWSLPIYAASLLAILACFLIAVLGLPRSFAPAVIAKLNISHWLSLWSNRPYLRATFAYWGHMWELYAFWALVPLFTARFLPASPLASFANFAIMGSGAIGCWWGGQLAPRVSSDAVARWALRTSATCCALYPLVGPILFSANLAPIAAPFAAPVAAPFAATVAAPFAATVAAPFAATVAAPFAATIALLILFIWGLSVVADSPQFSALVAQSLEPHQLGVGFAWQNASGFALTIFAIEWTQRRWPDFQESVAWFLLPGPLIALWCLKKK